MGRGGGEAIGLIGAASERWGLDTLLLMSGSSPFFWAEMLTASGVAVSELSNGQPMNECVDYTDGERCKIYVQQ